MLPSHLRLTDDPSNLPFINAVRHQAAPLLRLVSTREEAARLALLLNAAIDADALRIASIAATMKPGDVIEIPGPLCF
jgi:hypothetical protein